MRGGKKISSRFWVSEYSRGSLPWIQVRDISCRWVHIWNILYLILVIPLAALLSNALRWPPNKFTCGPRRRRDPSGRDPRRRAPVAYELLFSVHWTVLYRLALNYRACNVMLPPPSPPPIGSGDIVGDWTEALSAFTWSSPLGLGTCHLFLGELSVYARCGCPSLRCMRLVFPSSLLAFTHLN